MAKSKEEKAAYDKAYCLKNKEAKEAKAKVYRDKNKEKKRIYNLNNSEAIAKKSKEYKENNKKAISDKRKEYFEVNKEIINAKKRETYKKNPEKSNLTSQDWYRNNKERSAEYKRKYRAENPEVHQLCVQNRRARKLMAGGTLSKGIKEKLFKLQRGKCPCCNKPLGNKYHLDHIMPLFLGGSNTDDNIQLLRAECNFQKNSKHPFDFMQSRGFLF